MKYSINKIGDAHHCIKLSSRDAAKLAAGGNKRVVCTLNKTVTLHAAIMPAKDGLPFILIASKYLKQLKLKAGMEVEAVIKRDTSELQFHVPEEFTEVLATDPEAEKIFTSLTAGNKRGLIAIVNMVKSSDKKIERALKIATKLKQGITSPQKMLK